MRLRRCRCGLPVRILGETYRRRVYDRRQHRRSDSAVLTGFGSFDGKRKGQWNPGFVATFRSLKRRRRVVIKRSSSESGKTTAIAGGGNGEFGRHIEIKELKADVALHYLIDFSQDRLTEAVNLGVERARAWCRENALPLKESPGEFPTEVHTVQTKVSFTEEMKGYFTLGELDYERISRGPGK